MNRWFVVHINRKMGKLSKHCIFEDYKEAYTHFCKKVPAVTKNNTDVYSNIMMNAWFSHSGYIIIDSKRCQVEWVIDYIKPLIIEERNKTIDKLLDY